MTTTHPILEMKGITKTFPGVKALTDVELTVMPAEIHAVVGENGAGKSTLMKVLSGVYPAGTYDGTITFEGKDRQFKKIADSENIGIIIIHQELALVPLLSIAENIFLGHETAKHGIINWFEAFSRTKDLLAKVGLSEHPNTLITNIGTGKQQLVEIAKALNKKVKLLILDEPTSSLNEKDSNALLELLKGFKAQGISSILITHKLNEVMKAADRITVIRDGKTIDSMDVHAGEVNEDRIIKAMVGRDLSERYPPRTPKLARLCSKLKTGASITRNMQIVT
jgi:putative multiple sugar transport system ATP-binding protein